MKVRVIRVFRDKTTDPIPAKQVRREIGDIIECDDALALERVKGGFVELVDGKKDKKDKKSKEVVEEPVAEEETKVEEPAEESKEEATEEKADAEEESTEEKVEETENAAE